jgi:hypothetical protein
MDPNSDSFLILRARTNIRHALEMTESMTRHINDVEIASLTNSEFMSLIKNASDDLNKFCRISLRNGGSMDLQIEAIRLYNHIHRAKGHLEQAKPKEDIERYYCQRQCEALEKMLSEISQKLYRSKRKGVIFDAGCQPLGPSNRG